MLKNYLTIAFRSIRRNKFYSIINIFGLGIGIACCLLISLFVKDEWTFDRFHHKASRIYRAYVKEDYGANQQFFNTVTPFPLGPALKNNFGEVEQVVRLSTLNAQVKSTGEQFSELIHVVDPAFFTVFDFTGNDVTNVMELEATGVIVTRDLARKYFGSENAINKPISIQLRDTFEDFVVKGVIENPPNNSSIRFSMMISSLNYNKLYSERALTSGWFNVTPETYVLLREGTDINQLTKKFPAVFKSLIGDDFEKSKYEVGLQPLTDIHLDREFPAGIAPVSDARYSYIMASVALLVLTLASINFVTLSVGQTLKRAKEVGVRKVVGAARSQLITQFIGEALLVTFIALVVGIAISGMSLPHFNDLSGKALSLTPNRFTLVMTLALTVVIGLFAGSYPAFILSEFKPIAILKGKLQGDSKQNMRKVLVGVQLVLAIFLVSSAMIMNNQLRFLVNRNLGFDKEQMISIQMTAPNSGRFVERLATAFEKARVLKNEYGQIPSVETTCAASHDFGNGDWTEIGYTDENKIYRNFYLNVVDADFIPAMKISLAAGRKFSSDNQFDERNAVIVNEAFVKEMGWTDALGKRIPGKDFMDHEIIGVVSDFNFQSLYINVKPLVLTQNPEIVFSGAENVMMDNSPIPKLLVKIQSGNIGESVNQLKAGWEKIYGQDSFTFGFVDERINAQYRADQNLGDIITNATVVSILIGCLGLYALASLSIQNRVKEISIRKVLGATSRSLLVLVSKDFFVLIIISVILSVPLTIYFMSQWLRSYEYKIRIDWTVFGIAGAIALVLGLATIGYHTIKTVLAQPSETLKNE